MTSYFGADAPEATAEMQIDSTTKGALIPRMTTAQRDAISSPAESLLIFNTDTNAYNWYDDDNSTWRELSVTEKTIFLSAREGYPSTTNGCAAAAQTEFGTNDVDIFTLDFDTSSDEYAQWFVTLPGDYDGGTFTARFHWTATGGSAAQTVEWGIQGRAFANDDAIDQAWGTIQTVNDALIATSDLHISDATSAMTLAGSPAAGQLAIFRVQRDVSADNLAADAKLIGVELSYSPI